MKQFGCNKSIITTKLFHKFHGIKHENNLLCANCVNRHSPTNMKKERAYNVYSTSDCTSIHANNFTNISSRHAVWRVYGWGPGGHFGQREVDGCQSDQAALRNYHCYGGCLKRMLSFQELYRFPLTTEMRCTAQQIKSSHSSWRTVSFAWCLSNKHFCLVRRNIS